MSIATTPSLAAHSIAAPTSAVRRLANLLRAGVADLVRALAHRRNVRQLLELDERCLNDIGLTRGDVIGALDQPYGVDPSAILAVRSLECRRRLRRVAPSRRVSDVVLTGGEISRPGQATKSRP